MEPLNCLYHPRVLCQKGPILFEGFLYALLLNWCLYISLSIESRITLKSTQDMVTTYYCFLTIYKCNSMGYIYGFCPWLLAVWRLELWVEWLNPLYGWYRPRSLLYPPPPLAWYFQGWYLEKPPFFSSGFDIFFIAFTWSTLAVAAFANSSPNNIGAEESKLSFSSAINFRDRFSPSCAFLGPFAGEHYPSDTRLFVQTQPPSRSSARLPLHSLE